MATPLSLFDPELLPSGWFDPELDIGSWFDRDFFIGGGAPPLPPGVITTGKYVAMAVDRETRSLYLAILTAGTGTWNYWYNLDPDVPNWVNVGVITTGAKVDWPAGLEVTSDSFHRLLFEYTDTSGATKRLTSVNRDGAWGAE